MCADIYEVVGGNLELVVTHIFWGDTLERVHEIDHAHRKTDKFWRAAIEGEEFDGIVMDTFVRVERTGEEKPLQVFEVRPPRGRR